MTFVLLYTVMLAMRGFSVSAAAADRSECGVRPPMSRRNARTTIKYHPRSGRIIDGSPTREGQFPWQVSLELLHPSLGFIGHWCGAVLIDRYWVLSAAHCIHNDLFNLPLPPLWTVVLGEFNRHVESGYEQRISVDRIVMHQDYENYQHDLVMIKLAEPADMGAATHVRKICLPFIAFKYPQSVADNDVDALLDDGPDRWSVPDRDDNQLRAIKLGTNRGRGPSARRGRSQNATTITSTAQRRSGIQWRRPPNVGKSVRRRNDKFLHGRPTALSSMASDEFGEERRTASMISAGTGGGLGDDEPPQDLPYVDCIATGWGKSTIGGDLTDILLQTQVPIHPNGKCTTAYGENVRIHRGHLCAGKLNGKGGTCVGDSGGPLQCRISKNGPWLLAGVTSFGSGCAEQGYPDVYSRISHYVQWITETMSENGSETLARRRFGK